MNGGSVVSFLARLKLADLDFCCFRRPDRRDDFWIDDAVGFAGTETIARL
ncbi:MAG: hypothetical protein ACRC8Y_00100 [Chroococcales cyanobacterium]